MNNVSLINAWRSLCASILNQAIKDRDVEFCLGEASKDYRQALCSFIGMDDIADMKTVQNMANIDFKLQKRKCLLTKKCVFCGATYVTYRQNSKTCSVECRSLAKRQGLIKKNGIYAVVKV